MNLRDRFGHDSEPAGLCPITGLPVFQKSEWIDVGFGKDYRVTLQVLGHNILYSRPAGYATRHDTERALNLTDQIAHDVFGPDHPYVQIENYVDLQGASLEARRYFIENMQPREWLTGLIFCHASPFFKMSIKLAKRLNILGYKVQLVDDYPEAVRMALDMLSGQGILDAHPSPKATAREDWVFDFDGFAIEYGLIDEQIMHSFSRGFLEEKHIDPLFESMDRVARSMGLRGKPFFVINGIKELEGVTRKARKRYTERIVQWYEENPFRLFVFYGANRYISAAVNLARPFVPFKLRLARDLTHALSLVTPEKRRRIQDPQRAERGRQGNGIPSPLSTEKYVHEILNFLGSINWERDGPRDHEFTVDPAHPFGPVFDAVALIKMDIDQLLRERSDATEALRENERKYRTILESMEEGCYEVDIAGHFTFVNKALSGIFGCPDNELIGTSYRQHMDAENAEKVYGTFNRVFLTGEPDRGFGWEIIRKDGSKGYVETSISLLSDAGGTPIGFRGLLRDLTERRLAEEEKKRLESQLQQAQRMEAIGTLAGGIAHNFNNILMGIQGNASLMALDLDSAHPLYKRIKTIESLVLSGANLTKQLLGYAREGRYEINPIDLNQLVKETGRTFGPTRKDITIHWDLEEPLLAVMADRGQIEQVLMNLYVNAADAMPTGGDLLIGTAHVTSGDLEGRPYKPKNDQYVMLTVRDTGVGMDEKTRDRVFEPFFTTKGLSRGTGLGLASAYGIIKAHGGFIDVYSKKEHGATFEIYLPATQAEAGRETESVERIEPGKGTILIVDDETVVLEVGASLLERLNYSVLQARSGNEALETYIRHMPDVDLVILDMIMPETGGGEVYDRLREIDPHVKVILSSGYSINGQASEILARGCNDFIQKPFSIEQLSAKIGDVLKKQS